MGWIWCLKIHPSDNFCQSPFSVTTKKKKQKNQKLMGTKCASVCKTEVQDRSFPLTFTSLFFRKWVLRT